VEGKGMIENLEVEVTAHAFQERVDKQDQICLSVQKFIQEKEPSLGEIKVWLVLSNLGHSWED